ncbi:DNA double-strand break repair nuclease NurA [Desulfofalx alkaliphila]|uniref:DNA double-strand break repair nuclease NurA n=1 Tax=Desulfofalx alkaliphila TaxID=105483 RepID=UPI00146FACAD|nr:DNA double-strand break repair nuclease NurA [Desulfofalx alkaliphila]
MVVECKSRVDINNKKLSVAKGAMAHLKDKWQQITHRVRESKTSWLVAEPMEEVDAVHSPIRPPREYTVLATDGSQIMPDHHQVVLCYLINIGKVVLHYGEKAAAKLTNDASLYFKEEDLYMDEDGAKRLVDSQRVSAMRTLAETKALVELAQQDKQTESTVAFADGTLIHWTSAQQAWSKQFLEEILANYEYLYQLKVPLVGYISGTRSTDVVNMLRVAMCPHSRVDCDHCQWRNLPEAGCEQVSGLRDAVLFSDKLKYGQRSAVFKSRSQVLEKYGRHWVCFFYVNLGAEVARVEIPLWVAENKKYLDLVHCLVIDQVIKGLHYPLCLSEAHRQAVVTGSDRELFYQLVNNKLIENGLKSEISYKSLRKRSVPV